MSKNLYSIFEYIDQATGQWSPANLYTKRCNGIFDFAQLIVGKSEYYDALFGQEPFCCPVDAEGEIVDNLVDPLERIEEVISDAISGYIPSNVSADTKEYYERFVIAEWVGNPDKKQFPKCVTYTLRDLEIIEMLAKGVSASALRFYNKYFAQVRWLLHTVKRLEFISSGSSVRVIIWGF